ncbi:MAG: hypothetical protein BGO98_11060 [Myxococcales bacterium 68-20]|nr:hypothetical protein [Myxococcales bacterium]OJY16731.1 MAG: hypothetical protein BGO98_11060 [Myxococcales bacterium 68-20]
MARWRPSPAALGAPGERGHEHAGRSLRRAQGEERIFAEPFTAFSILVRGLLEGEDDDEA